MPAIVAVRVKEGGSLMVGSFGLSFVYMVLLRYSKAKNEALILRSNEQLLTGVKEEGNKVAVLWALLNNVVEAAIEGRAYE